MLIGCLDGTVHQWQLGSLPVVCMAVKGSVIHMAWDHRRKVAMCVCVCVCMYVCVQKHVTIVISLAHTHTRTFD